MSTFLHHARRNRAASSSAADGANEGDDLSAQPPQTAHFRHGRSVSVDPGTMPHDVAIPRRAQQQQQQLQALSAQTELALARNKLTGWISTMIPAKSSPSKPAGTGPTRLKNALDRASNYLFDTDSNVDRSPDDIWVLGVVHPGYREPLLGPDDHLLPEASTSAPSESYLYPHVAEKKGKKGRLKAGSPSPRNSKSSRRRSDQSIASASQFLPSPTMHHKRFDRDLSPPGSVSSDQGLSVHSDEDLSTPTASQLLSISSVQSSAIKLPTLEQTNGWPPEFFLDFASRIQLTYRTGFPPILSPTPGSVSDTTRSAGFKDFVGSLTSSIGKPHGLGLGGSAAGWTCDTGWGCMLRTGQSLLANALAELHLGRGAFIRLATPNVYNKAADWRRPLPDAPSQGVQQVALPADYAKYVRLLSWFLDDPSPMAPFSVHRFALVGKKLGKEVGQWFGPSTAAGAIRTLCEDFSPAELAVYAPVENSVYKTEIRAASNNWTKPVLILLNVRLGISGVNPVYFPHIKSLYTFPQHVGIAGGRPSSSYYFVGCQGDSLFYIDPHYPKPCVEVCWPADEDLVRAALSEPLSAPSCPDTDDWEHLDAPTINGRHHKTSSYRSEDSNSSAPKDAKPPSQLDQFFTQAYLPSDLSTYHPERVRKMALTGLDPSMLVGFLIRSEADFDDWRSRSTVLKSSIYAIGDEPPGWSRHRSVSRTSSTTAWPVANPTRPPVVETPNEDEEASDASWDISDTDSSALEVSNSVDVLEDEWEQPDEVLDAKEDLGDRPVQRRM